jgi:hypothetical protein
MQMYARRSRVTGLLAGAIGLASLMPAFVSGQAQAQAPAGKRSIPRLADGHPDLQGMYDLATLTPVERRAGAPLVMTDEEAAKLEKQVAATKAYQAAPIKADRDAPPLGGDGSAGPAGNVGGYNSFWIDSGAHYSIIDGQKRTSIVIDPIDGRIPQLTPEARQRTARNVRPTSDQSAREDDPGFEGAGAYDDPERRPLGERCLMGFGSTSGPPVLPNYFYNNLHQIVQTPDAVLILTEMVHDARIVRMNSEHLPKTIRKWLGDSIGRWEGDTLVVDTVGFLPGVLNGSVRNSDKLHVVERFSLDPKTMKLTRAYTADDAVYLKGQYSGSDVIQVADAPYTQDHCKEQGFLDYSKQVSEKK